MIATEVIGMGSSPRRNASKIGHPGREGAGEQGAGRRGGYPVDWRAPRTGPRSGTPGTDPRTAPRTAPTPPPSGTGWDSWHRDRSAELPHDWPIRRQQVLDRDGGTCTWRTRGVRCMGRANEVDHVGNPHDHDVANLRSLCTPHHRARTAVQGGQASARARTRPAEAHPFDAVRLQAVRDPRA